MNAKISEQIYKKKQDIGTSLVIQWVRLRTPSAGGPGSIPGQGTRSCMRATTKSLHATTKSPHATTKKSTCHTQLKDPACHNKDPECHN